MTQILPFTTITELQRKPREVIANIDTYKVVLSNNEEIAGVVNINFLRNIIQIIQEQNSNYTDEFIAQMEQSEKDIKKGNVIGFDNMNDAIAYLDTL